MSPDIQIAIDADDPHELNRFWAAVMDYAIEDHRDQVTQVLDAGYASIDDTVEIDGRRAWKTAAACRPRTGPGSRLLFQHVPEAKSAKNRVHLDLHVGAGIGTPRSSASSLSAPRACGTVSKVPIPG